MRSLLSLALAAAVGVFAAGAAPASEGPAIPKRTWSWDGVFGQYDVKQLQRGFLVFKDVCSNCHAMKLVAYRNLTALGLSEDAIKKIAAEKEVMDGPNDAGDMFKRPARLSDRIVPPFPNDNAARSANNGALPPDLSLMAKARKGGPDYIHALMMGYKDPPKDVTVADGMNYNTAFPGNQIAMPPQMQDDLVTYADGTKATADQIAQDIAAFLNWAAEPELNERKSLGLKTMIFLVVLTAMLYALKRKIWADLH
ncbi:MAG: cytochrome c1 [Rhodospirillales bacterium]|nr:cytochrome c1 [Rhodospirillales bacterium]